MMGGNELPRIFRNSYQGDKKKSATPGGSTRVSGHRGKSAGGKDRNSWLRIRAAPTLQGLDII